MVVFIIILVLLLAFQGRRINNLVGMTEAQLVMAETYAYMALEHEEPEEIVRRVLWRLENNEMGDRKYYFQRWAEQLGLPKNTYYTNRQLFTRKLLEVTKREHKDMHAPSLYLKN